MRGPEKPRNKMRLRKAVRGNDGGACSAMANRRETGDEQAPAPAMKGETETKESGLLARRFGEGLRQIDGYRRTGYRARGEAHGAGPIAGRRGTG